MNILLIYSGIQKVESIWELENLPKNVQIWACIKIFNWPDTYYKLNQFGS